MRDTTPKHHVANPPPPTASAAVYPARMPPQHSEPKEFHPHGLGSSLALNGSSHNVRLERKEDGSDHGQYGGDHGNRRISNRRVSGNSMGIDAENNIRSFHSEVSAGLQPQRSKIDGTYHKRKIKKEISLKSLKHNIGATFLLFCTYCT